MLEAVTVTPGSGVFPARTMPLISNVTGVATEGAAITGASCVGGDGSWARKVSAVKIATSTSSSAGTSDFNAEAPLASATRQEPDLQHRLGAYHPFLACASIARVQSP